MGHAKKSSASPRIFCSDEDGNDDDEWRGFFCRLIGRNESEALKKYYGPKEAQEEPFPVYAHLIVARNPFQLESDRDDSQRRYLVVLDGAAGPATLALVHVLTGQGRESAREGFDPAEISEKILNMLLEQMEERDFFALHCFLKVTVRLPKKEEGKPR